MTNSPILPAEAAEELLRRRSARRSLIDFTRYTKPDYETNWHHRILCEYLDKFIGGDIKRLMVFMPPRHGKSELVSRRLPAYILGRKPDTSIIACSYSTDLSSRMNRDVQRIIDGPEYKALFPETTLSGANIRTVAQGTYLRNSDIFEVMGHRGVYRSAGVGGGITGMGCVYGLIDDPIKNQEEANSETYRNGVWEWYTSTFYTRLEKDAQILLTMTRWHEDDLAGRLLELAKTEGSEQWTIINFPAVAEGGNPDDPRAEGEPLWENKYNSDRLAEIKSTLGSYHFGALYQQHPSPAEGGMLQRAWWKYYREAPDVFDEVIQSWDMAFKDTKTSDFVVGQVWGRKGANKYLLDQVRGRMDFPASVQAVKNLTAKWPNAKAKLVEDKANGTAVIATLKDKIAGLIAVEPEGGKESRASAVSPEIEAGNVYLPEGVGWVSDFVEECAAFPMGTHDDQVDAMSQALLRLSKGAAKLKISTNPFYS